MAVNITKNKEALSQAWKEVVDEKNKTDWALFGYDGHTFDLKVVGKGDGGLEEMVEDLNSGKIMYAFCRVIDPKTSLPKFVLINWQGEGAPGDKKGKCANHITDISSLLRGAHVTMNARTEDDVDPSIIMEMVVKATGSSYSFKDRECPVENLKPVGSVYKRIIPATEINPAERDKFWEKQENEEKRRVEGERKQAAEARRKLEEERRQREIQDAQRRDKMLSERTSSISQLRAAENAAGKTVYTDANEKKLWEKQLKEDANDQQERKNRSESTRQERKEELHALISQRTINARAIFEQNTSIGQMSNMNSKYSGQASQRFQSDPVKETITTNGDQNQFKSNSYTSSVPSPSSTNSPPSYGSPLSPERTPPPSPAPESTPMSYRAPAASESMTNSYTNSQTMSYLANAQQHPSVDLQRHSPEGEKDYWDETARVGKALKGHSQNGSSQRNESPQPENNYTQEKELASAKLASVIDGHPEIVQDQGLMARALYDYQAADDTEISFNPDDIITNVDQIDEGWWQGLAPDGMYGLFPANYVELLE